MKCKYSSVRQWLTRREAADFIGEEKVKLDYLARKENKRRKELPYHMRGNKACYYINDLNEYEKRQQTF
ncbi:hypothetical protein [Niastella populi]|uniref:Helix-turn-helix domain-containing protein n=1 Tax=Niastella populi TaxID=550983 RepID=A0A1V9ESL1_9BACT|nr:hypothetical protein [Niastella populi]OQP49071.1 hypothetical protein A4R26_31150 [Niastella populi]